LKSIKLEFQRYKCLWRIAIFLLISDFCRAGSFYFVLPDESLEIKNFISGFSKGYDIKDSDVHLRLVDEIDQCDTHGRYITFGVPSAEKIASLCGLQSVVVVDSEYNVSLFESKLDRTISAIFVDQSIEQQSSLFRKHIPHLNKIGVLYESDYERSKISEAERASSKKFTSMKVEPGDNPGPYFGELIKDVDAILITSNSRIWQRRYIRGFLLYSLRQGKVILGGPTKDYIRAGVFAGVYTDMKKLGEKSGIILKDSERSIVRIHPDKGQFLFNRFLASRLSIQVSEN